MGVYDWNFVINFESSMATIDCPLCMGVQYTAAGCQSLLLWHVYMNFEASHIHCVNTIAGKGLPNVHGVIGKSRASSIENYITP